MKRFVLVAYIVTSAFAAFSQNPIQSKTGGICFRVDDHQGAAKWRDWNNVFNQRGQKFSLAINASRLFNDTAAVNALREIAAAGHELMDHTPDHHMGFFTVKTLADTSAFSGNPAVDHINGTKVCLKVDAPFTESFMGETAVNLIGNKLISTNNGGFVGINGNPYYALVYLPNRNQYAVYTSVQNKNASNPDTLVLQTYWQETWKNDTAYNIPYHRIGTVDVRSNAQANVLLAQRSKQLFAQYGLPAPTTWIQPGGNYALLNRFEVKSFADQVAYTAGAVNILSAQKCYNEVDSFSNRRFSIQGPDFYEESNNYQGLINIISDRSARHYHSFGLSHMTNVQGGWSTFLARVDSVLNWSIQNNIPIRTYKQWASILYDSIPNQAANVLPALNRDLNNNNFPDGYNTNSLYDATDGVAASGFKCFSSANNNASLASISNLGGLEKGSNLVSMYTKGKSGDSIRMVITYPEMALPTQMVMFAANTDEWTLQTKIINIPANITRVNVSWILLKRTVPGAAKMCGMVMRKSSMPVLNKGYLQQKKSTEAYAIIPLDGNTNDGYFPLSDLSFQIGTLPGHTFSFNSTNRILLVQTERAFYTGKDSVLITVSNPDGQIDQAWFRFESKAHEINLGDTLQTTIALNFDSATIFCNQAGSYVHLTGQNFVAAPRVNSIYHLFAYSSGQLLTDSFTISVIGGTTPTDSLPTDTSSTDTIIVTPIPPTNAFYNKTGGVCFRVEDHQSAANWRGLLNTFATYNAKLTLGINASRLIGDTAAVNALKELAAAGHEIADHTPDHSMAFFNVNLVQDTNIYRGNAGVDHFTGKKVCLKIDSVITSNYSLEGLVNVNGNILISQNNGEWKTMGAPVYYSNIYLPYNNQTYTYTNLLNKNMNDPDTLTLQSYWGETVNLGIQTGLAHHRVTQYDIKPSASALFLLMNRTQYILDSLGLPRPVTFLQPSGNYAMLNRAEAKAFFGNLHGFVAGGVYTATAFKCYNEVNTGNDKQFAFHGPDFKEENTSALSIIGTIADNSAKHHSSFGLSMMYNMTGGRTAYLQRCDSILNWCNTHGIPVRTMAQWASYLYDSIPNPFVNVIPALNKDLNKNGVPDGYSSPAASFDTTDGTSFSGNCSYSRNSNGTLATTQNLGGLEKGSNILLLSTKGMVGDSVRVTISFPETNQSTLLVVPANTATFTEYSYTLTIPALVSRMTLTYTAMKRTNPGNIKISGLQLYANGLLKSSLVQTETQIVDNNLKESTGPIDLTVYPNPFTESFMVSGKLSQEGTQFRVMNLQGKQMEANMVQEGNVCYISLPNAEPGLYFLTANSAHLGIYTLKILKL